MLIETQISILGILATTWMAVYAIRKTAEANRISNTHSEMLSCLIETAFVLHESISLLDDIGRHVIYSDIPEEKIIETAYDRYWKTIGALSKEFKKLQSKQKLVLPINIYLNIQKVIEKLNNARELAKYSKPDENNIYPDTTELNKAITEAFGEYRKLINLSRKYSGPNALTPLSAKEDNILRGNEKINKTS